MKINFTEINELLQKGNLAEISRETGIAYRTLQDWKLGNNKWLQQAEERLSSIQSYIERDYMGIDKELYKELIHDLEADISNEEVGYDVYVIRDNNQLEYPDQYNPVIDYKSTSQPMIDLDQYGIIIIDFMYAEDLLNELKTELQNFINQEEKKMNVNDIKNVDYIWVFDDLSEFLDSRDNFKNHVDFEWWKELADALAYMEEEQEIDTNELEINELQDYVDIAEEHGFEA